MRTSWIVLGVLCSGCLTLEPLGGGSGGGEAEPEIDTVEIGTYDVDASRSSNGCGEGLLVSGPTMGFATTLSEDEEGERIFWDSGSGPQEGELREEGERFIFRATATIDVRSPETDDDWLPPCVLVRTELVEGRFDEERTSFEGTMSFYFEQAPGSDCSDVIGQGFYFGQEAVLGAVPCDTRYELSGFAADES
jgi:hypothetical protein